MSAPGKATANLFWFATFVAYGGAAHAQTTIAPAVQSSNDPEYTSRGATLGPVRIVPSFDFSAEFNDNVYASRDNEKSDTVFVLSPQLRASYSRQNVDLNAVARLNVTRFASLTTENSISAATQASAVWRPQTGFQVGADMGFSRLVEDRGDVERLKNQASGPRKTNLLSAGATIHRERGRIMFDLTTLAQKYDALADRDADRDFSAYSLVAKTGVRITGSTYATVTGFVSYRDFRLLAAGGSLNRDSMTYGARAGLDFTSNSFLDGHIGVGVFRFNARADAIDDHTGLSIDAAITYRPRRRTAIVLNAFKGDVATFRLGASSRTDTNVGLAVQQEVRHNLFGTAALGWRETRYRSNSDVLRTYEAQAKVEYLLSRRLSTIGAVTYVKRTSNNPFEPYERFRAGVSVRLTL